MCRPRRSHYRFGSARTPRVRNYSSCHAASNPDVRPRRAPASTASPTPSATSSRRRGRSRPPGRGVRYLNIGDPIPFGFSTPPHLIEAVARADARRPQRLRAVAGHHRGARGGGRGLDAGAASRRRRSRAHHVRHVGRHRAGADGARRPGRRGARARRRPIRSTRRCSRRSAPRRATTGPTHRTAGCRISTTSSADHAAHARAGRHRSEQPHRRDLSGGDPAHADRPRRAARPGAPRRRGVRRSRVRRSGRRRWAAWPRRADHLVLQPLEGVPRARLAHRLDGGRPIAAARRRARRDQEARGRPPVQHRPDAVRHHAGAARRSHPPGVVPRGAAGARRRHRRAR